MILRDLEIRTALHRHLLRRNPQPVTLIDELGIHNGNAIADVVAFYDDMHCFEIKGETDNVRRIKKQGAFYNETFPKISIVTTENHLQWCIANSPEFWGVIVAYLDEETVKLKYVRAIKHNPFVDKKKALMTLWRAELWEIALNSQGVKVKKNYDRERIANEISKGLTKKATLTSIQRALLSRTRLNLGSNEGNVTR